MARANKELIRALRIAANQLESGAEYSWGHVGQCNCGHLAQCITGFSSNEIFKQARTLVLDEWSEFANDYCSSSGCSVESIIDAMLAIGMAREDIHQLEYLSNSTILHALPGGFRYLRKNNREDVIVYMRTWATLLDEQLGAATSVENQQSADFEMPLYAETELEAAESKRVELVQS